MENEKNEEKNNLLQVNVFKTSFKKQDVTNMPSFQKWSEEGKKRGSKIVRCPSCWSYEKSEKSYQHKCQVCGEYYCQKCLMIVEQYGHHELYCIKNGCRICCKNCCDGCFCGLWEIVELIFDECSSHWRLEWYEYLFMTLLFLFGTPIMFTIKYFNFFLNNRITDNCCVHWFFTFLNLMCNIIYCIIYNFLFCGISFILFSPSLIYFPTIKLIGNNWKYVYRYDVSECPITQLTVRKR